MLGKVIRKKSVSTFLSPNVQLVTTAQITNSARATATGATRTTTANNGNKTFCFNTNPLARKFSNISGQILFHAQACDNRGHCWYDHPPLQRCDDVGTWDWAELLLRRVPLSATNCSYAAAVSSSIVWLPTQYSDDIRSLKNTSAMSSDK